MSIADTTPGEIAPRPYKPWRGRKVIPTVALPVVLIAAAMMLTVLLGA